MDWSKLYRGGSERYGESIYTERWELIGNYQLPVSEKLLLSVSYNNHNQNSYYGNVPYMADQEIAFGQLTWDKTLGAHDLLMGVALRYTMYDDNTTATALTRGEEVVNNPDEIFLPGLFVQDEIALNDKHKILLGLRYDYNSRHGNIYTPRMAYKFALNRNNVFRLNAGTGFRVVNLFTEEHASLTGARDVVVEEELKPERSYNVNLNYIKKVSVKDKFFLDIDLTAWHTYFTNQILPDYETAPDSIIYDNLDGHAITQGLSLNLDFSFLNGMKILAGGSFMDVHTIEENEFAQKIKARPLLTEKWTGTWAFTYPVPRLNLLLNYTGNLYGPMRLPLAGRSDPRPANSPWWSIQNIQVTWSKPGGVLEIYGGVKNLLNFTPPSNSIARAHDPFDNNVFDSEGNAGKERKGKPVPTENNPYALTFDPSYVYAPNQGIRGFLGIRFNINDH